MADGFARLCGFNQFFVSLGGFYNMAKTALCHCGQKGVVEISKGKHKTPFLRCPVHGVLMNRKKSWIDYLLSVSVDEPDPDTSYKKESDLLEDKTDKQDLETRQESDSSNQTPVVKNSLFQGWGTVI